MPSIWERLLWVASNDLSARNRNKSQTRQLLNTIDNALKKIIAMEVKAVLYPQLYGYLMTS